MPIDEVVEGTVWPVNSRGEMIIKQGSGDTKVAGYLPAAFLPQDIYTGKTLAVFEGLNAAPRGPKKIVAVGDSLVDYGDNFGRLFTNPSALPFLIMEAAPLTAVAANGSITWDATAKTLQWTANGDTPGPIVKLTGSGKYTLPSGTTGNELPVKVKWALIAGIASQTITLAYFATVWRKTRGGFMHIADAKTGHRFQVLRNFGISGIGAFDIVGQMMQQVIDTGADIIVDNAGTNDIYAFSRTGEQAADARIACWDQAGAAGRQIIALLISPRWGRDITGAATEDSVRYSKVFQDRIAAANRRMIAAAATRPWVRIADATSTSIDGTQADGRVRNGYTWDGLHDDGGLAYERAIVISRILDGMYPDDRSRVNVGAGSNFDATNNPGGNMMAAGQGQFAGTGGTAGTGATAGTGIAAGYTLGRTSGAAVAVVGNKVAATDGGQDWQELVVSGAAVSGEIIRLLATTVSIGSVLAIGDLIEYSVEFKVIGTGCTGVSCELITSVGYNPSMFSLRTVVQGLRDGENGVLSTEPWVVQTGASGVAPTIYVSSNAGASFRVLFRTADLRKIL